MTTEVNLPKQDKFPPEDLIREVTFGEKKFRIVDTSKLPPKVASTWVVWFRADAELTSERRERRKLGMDLPREWEQLRKERKRRTSSVIEKALGFGPEGIKKLLDLDFE